MSASHIGLLFLLPPLMGASVQEGSPPAPDDRDLTELSLEELMNIDVEVTSVSKKAQSLTSSAAAIYVVTREDIRRSGARTIPEALRMVPGLHVARINAHTWSITARGFSGQFANKLLVLIDGRSVYTPTFSGVYWDVQDVMLEDIERIEVIRGPGAALWGANAVNGVINIITRSADKTQGTLLSTTVGSEDRGAVAVRHGGRFEENGAWRAYAKYYDRAGFGDPQGSGVEDESWQGRAGWRADWSPTEQDGMTVQGDVYRGEAHSAGNRAVLGPPFVERIDLDAEVEGGNLLARWTRTFSKDADLSLQAYYDVATRRDELVDQEADTLDLDYQHRLRVHDRHELLFGLGYRRIESEYGNTPIVTFDPDDREDDLYGAFLQDEITLVEDRLDLILGTKYEHNDFTGWEFQPNVRMVWTPAERHTLWGSVSRAVRTPSQVEDSGEVVFAVQPGPGPLNTAFVLTGNDNFESEELMAYELGYRVQPSSDLSFDVATFYNEYDNLLSFEMGTPEVQGGNVMVPLLFTNGLEGETWGVEVAAEWKARPDWTLHLAYTLLLMDLDAKSPAEDALGSENSDRNSPQNQLSLRSLYALRPDVDLDVALYYVDSVPGWDVPSYIRGDIRIGWRPDPSLEISLVGQGLFHDGEQEAFGDLFGVETKVEAGVYLGVTWAF